MGWNAWIENDGTVQRAIPPSTSADIVLDLSRYRYDAESSTAGAPNMATYIREAARQRSSTRIIIRASLLGAGDRVAFGWGAKPQQSITLDLSKLAAPDKSALDAAERQMSETLDEALTPMLSRLFGLGQFRVPIMVKAGAPACFQIAYTIWDGEDIRPLDHVVLTASTIAGKGSRSCGVAHLQGGFGAMAGAMSSAGTGKAAASLYIFEYHDTTQALQTRAIFVDVQGGASAAGPAMYSWAIPGSLTDYLSGNEFEAAIRFARGKENPTDRYSEVARELKSKFFPFDIHDKKDNSSKAFARLANLSGPAGTKPLVLARYLSDQGKHVYAPLAILNASPAVTRKFQVSYPLPREDYAAGRCIGKYSLAYPKKITGRQTQLELDTVAAPLPVDRFRRIEDDGALRCYFNLEGDKCAQDSPSTTTDGEAVVLLAHQSEGLLWYTSDRVLDRIVIDDGRRSFAPGSAAFLSACSALKTGANADRLVFRLNAYGVDAIVASPFPVDLNYGILLSRQLVEVMAAANAKNEILSVYQMFDRAVERIRAVPANNKKFGEMDVEFLVLGNGDIRTCR